VEGTIIVVNCFVPMAFLGACIDCFSDSSRYWNIAERNKICDISTVHNFHDTRTEFQKFILKTKFVL